jgi:hypothetical protein
MILTDTGFFIALGNNGDRYHSRAIQVISSLREPLVTTYPVITETSYLLARDAGLAVQFEFLTEIAHGTFPIFDFQRQHLCQSQVHHVYPASPYQLFTLISTRLIQLSCLANVLGQSVKKRGKTNYIERFN